MKEQKIRRLVAWAEIKAKKDANYKPLTNPELWDSIPDPVIYMFMEMMDDLGISVGGSIAKVAPPRSVQDDRRFTGMKPPRDRS